MDRTPKTRFVVKLVSDHPQSSGRVVDLTRQLALTYDGQSATWLELPNAGDYVIEDHVWQIKSRAFVIPHDSDTITYRLSTDDYIPEQD